MPAYAFLFRGLNVGNRRVRMEDLKSMLQAAGCQAVSTVLQTGSAVALHPAESPDDAADQVERMFAAHFDFESKTVARRPLELQGTISQNPFPSMASDDPSHLLVYFARATVVPQDVAQVQAQVAGPEALACTERELVVAYPNGIGWSTLPKVKGFNKLVKEATARNWNTVLKLAQELERVSSLA
ncbi:MAG: DUF1697 domain-containing protein [Armatimonadetes bacterium]|nr:DUF1697 domain-containing protein [Armatimonadota bacterium]